jgi:UDP-glucuronate 4-epimerase
MKVLITGTAGFIGFHMVKKYVQAHWDVIGIDNINNYYSTTLKLDRLKESGIDIPEMKRNASYQSAVWNNYSFYRMDLEDENEIMKLFEKEKFDLVIHLAGQVGVRYSIENPRSYIQSNVVGFVNILEGCRHWKVKKLLYASSSSVYGISNKSLLSISDSTDMPVSLYAATKKSNELMAFTYSHLYGFKTVGMRFFTVYGPWGRPDMAPFLFVDKIINKTPINVFNHGNMKRDFTYIDDIIEGVFAIAGKDIEDANCIFNIGNSSPVNLLKFIELLEDKLQMTSKKIMLEMQPGDVVNTWADTKELIEATGYKPSKKIKEGVKDFVDWYKGYYGIV